MPNISSSDSIPSLELALLRWLCLSADLNDARSQALSALQRYKWRDEDHRIVFAALNKVPERDKRPLREQLPAIATRMGFPDIAWEDYFAVSAPITAEEILAILQKLADSGTTSE
jgi:hypothetical protein